MMKFVTDTLHLREKDKASLSNIALILKKKKRSLQIKSIR